MHAHGGWGGDPYWYCYWSGLRPGVDEHAAWSLLRSHYEAELAAARKRLESAESYALKAANDVTKIEHELANAEQRCAATEAASVET